MAEKPIKMPAFDMPLEVLETLKNRGRATLVSGKRVNGFLRFTSTVLPAEIEKVIEERDVEYDFIYLILYKNGDSMYEFVPNNQSIIDELRFAPLRIPDCPQYLMKCLYTKE